jgi:hypothetical protein
MRPVAIPLVLQNLALSDVLTGRYPQRPLESIREMALVCVAELQTDLYDWVSSIEELSSFPDPYRL